MSAEPQQTTDVAPPDVSSSVPRPVTPRARARSWAEMPVRVCMILTVLVLLVTAYFTITRVHEALTDRWLLRNGVDVSAKFTEVNGDSVAKRRPRNETMSARIVFTFNSREYNQVVQRLEAKPDAFAMVGSDQHGLKIRVDPNDPTHWTEVTEPRSWVQELTVVGLLLPLALLLVIVTFWKRRGVIKTWRNGALKAARVVEVRHTGMAPMSRVIRFTLLDGDDRRIFATLMPTRAGIPSPGQSIWLIVPPNRPNRSIVAQLYQ